MTNKWGYDSDAETQRISEDLRRQREEEYRKFVQMMKRYLKENK